MSDKRLGVRFAPDVNKPVEMDQNLALKLFTEGAVCILKDVPPCTEFGIDTHSWNVGEKFLGVKMVPPGLHFIYYSAVNTKFRDTAPRSGFFHWFKKGELIAYRWDAITETLVDDVSEEDKENMKTDLRNLDHRLGAYPYQSYNKWLMLTSRIKKEKLESLVPEEKIISSVTEMVNDPQGTNDDDNLPDLTPRSGTNIKYTQLSQTRCPPNASAVEITKHNLDRSYQLEQFITQLGASEEVLAELQFSFLCFLVGTNYASFEHWKHLVDLLCGCADSLLKHPQLFQDFITDLYFQMVEIPEDFFVDIISQHNFLVRALTNFFENIKETKEVSADLKQKAQRFENCVSKKFGWCFADEADEENLPVVVQM
jgi:A1 cistron-splicing factor AAR2